MSKATMAAAHAEQWLNEYLALGTERSIRKLASESRRIFGERGWPTPPTMRTFEVWSSKYGWDRQAKQYDVEVVAKAREELLRQHATLEEERLKLLLAHSKAFHSLVRGRLTIRTPRLDAMKS